jgi:hypothetical protein
MCAILMLSAGLLHCLLLKHGLLVQWVSTLCSFIRIVVRGGQGTFMVLIVRFCPVMLAGHQFCEAYFRVLKGQDGGKAS